jgi:hypothetical protein
MAKLLRDLFVRDGLSVFFDEDVNEIGELGGILEESIKKSRIVVLVISKGCFKSIIDGDLSADDNYWREIVCAVKEKGANGIIPVLTPDAKSTKDLPSINNEFAIIKRLRYIRYDGDLRNLMGNFYKDLKECIANFQDLDGKNQVVNRHKKKPAILITLLLLAIIAGLWAWKYHQLEEPVPIPIEITYAQAKNMLDCQSKDTVEMGYKIMDSLCQLNYIPAMYEIVRTIGWNTNGTSINRKDLLGKKYDEEKYPTDSNDNHYAVRLSERILDINDTVYAEINMNIAYLLCLYYSEDKFNIRDEEKSEGCLSIAEGWAEYLKDTNYINKLTAAKSNKQ